MSTTAIFSVPTSWQVVVPGDDPQAAVARAVDELFAGKDRDSSAVNKHWMRERLTRAVAMPEGVDATIVLFAFPKRPEAGVVLPVSATIVRTAGPELDEDADPLKALAALAANDPTAQPMPVLSTLALRTHEVREGAEAFAHELSEAPVSTDERAAIAAQAESVPILRARYIIPATGGRPWHHVEFSALLGDPDPDLHDLYLGLFDAFMRGMREVES